MKAIYKTLVAILLFTAAIPALAAPRIAIIVPLSGRIELAGEVLRGPKIAEEGQVLTLSKSAEVRIQLLGSNKETIVKDVTSYTIRRAVVEKEGKAISRGNLSVTGEVANLNRAAAFSTRSQSDYGRVDPDGNFVPLGVKLTLPPRLNNDGSWTIPLSFPDGYTPSPQSATKVTVSDTADYSISWGIDIEEEAPSLDFPPQSLSLGHRYKISISNKRGGYTRYFYAISNEDRQAISEHSEKIYQEMNDDNRLSTLLHLASFYQSLDNLEQVASVLMEAIKEKDFKELDADAQNTVVDMLNNALLLQDKAPYKG